MLQIFIFLGWIHGRLLSRHKRSYTFAKSRAARFNEIHTANENLLWNKNKQTIIAI